MELFKNLLQEYKVVTVDNFLSVEECNYFLAQVPNLKFRQTLVSDSESDYTGMTSRMHGTTTSSRVTSQSSYYVDYPQYYKDLTDALKERIALLIGLSVNHIESWQTSVYYKNNQFDYHEDCGLGEGNERWYTALIYLNKPIAGGQTDFLNLKKTIEPEPGRLVLWNNLTDDLRCNHQLLHAGLPVIEGEKNILVTWIRVHPV